MDRPMYSVVVPAYRSSDTLGELCARLIQVFETQIKESFEIVLVNDSSPDSTWDKMKELHGQDSRIKAINLTKNFGQHSATICGFSFATGDFIITMDDDLQHPPEEIPALVQGMQENPQADVVMGNYLGKKHSLVRNLGTRTMNRITSYISGKDPKLHLTSFRLLRCSIAKEMLNIEDDRPRLGYMILRLTNKIVNVDVKHDSRTVGESGYSMGRLIKDLVNNIMNNSSLPLKAISLIGFFSAILSFLLAVYYIYIYLFVGISVKGWTTLILIVLFYFGIILFSVGIIGKYLINILTGTKRYPQFVVKDSLL